MAQLVRDFPKIHSDAVLSLEFSPDDKTLATGAADKMARLIDLATGKVVRNFEGHTHHVLGVSWSADGRTLATAGADNMVKVWDAKTGDRKKNIEGYDKEVTAVRFVGASANLLTSSGDNKVRLVALDGKEVRAFPGSRRLHAIRRRERRRKARGRRRSGQRAARLEGGRWRQNGHLCPREKVTPRIANRAAEHDEARSRLDQAFDRLRLVNRVRAGERVVPFDRPRQAERLIDGRGEILRTLPILGRIRADAIGGANHRTAAHAAAREEHASGWRPSGRAPAASRWGFSRSSACAQIRCP